jgi:hypothetical protein
MSKFNTTDARELANSERTSSWGGAMRMALLWACDIIDAAEAALEPTPTVSSVILMCQICGANRYREPCKGDLAKCPTHGETQAETGGEHDDRG